MMSFQLQGYRIVPSVIIVQVVVGLAVPLVASYFPVNQGAKTTVRRAISDDSPKSDRARPACWISLASGLPFFPDR